MTYARVPVRRSKPLETLMMDICALNEDSVDGATMFLFIVDEATRYKWAFLLKRKSEATFYIKVLLNRLERRFPDQRVQLLWSDQAGEILGNELDAYCKERGIELKMKNPYSPQENGIVERENGVVLPRLRAMLMATNLPPILWGEALLPVVTTLNWLPTKLWGWCLRIRLFTNKNLCWTTYGLGAVLRTCGYPQSCDRRRKS
ncbi:Retrotransposon RIRE1 poly protein [Phytophthora megakarya]|uniref:Retrotransposon RIRE1 poly protein n=1 Tax=Phytophthora megakarya TaxID=4795 RepID=A0A225USK5_9STRA|nr:Retrotransposon RIRE1 poly protein [Phytophthora megakarya]